ncbi:O-antigen ligase family protein [Corynebacterium hindlerae]|uniref:O-antigen ligase family protein n=1 Tax=Corynebacterium hindlerae TaxID=699041 RepID=UPI0031B6F32C
MALAQPRTVVDRLPGWPAVLPFAGYLVWWLLGIGDFVWLIAGVVMAVYLLSIREFHIPRHLLLWLLFCGWVVVSLAMNDTAGRIVGAMYRLLLYAAAGMFAVYLYNARQALSILRVSRAMVWLLAGMTLCGYWALAMPELVIRTPMSYVIPGGLQRNPLVSDMVVRRLTQWNPDAWVEQAVRPVAPFLYANTWGNVYSLVLPFALIYLWLIWRTKQKWWALAVVLASIPPALSTLNRGMFIGLGVVGLWVIVQSMRRGFIAPLLKFVAGMAVAGAAWFFSPFGENFFTRIEETNSTEDRKSLYLETLDQTLISPLFGQGSPRPAEYPWLPSLGTQGQLWTVMYSHGFVGLVLFWGFLVAVMLHSVRRTDFVGALLGGIVLATLVETFYYGMMTGIMVTMVAIGILLRPLEATNSGDRLGIEVPQASTVRRSSRRRRATLSAARRRGRVR